LEQPLDHHYCFGCGRELPRSLMLDDLPPKSFRFFPGVKVNEGDPEMGFLRVSHYRKDQTFTTREGSVTIPGQHVRFSVWDGDTAKCVISIPETEARAMAGYLLEELGSLASN
jgi:hypothetical protein